VGKLIFSRSLEQTRVVRLMGHQRDSKSGYGNLARVLCFWFMIYLALFGLFMNVIDGEDGQQVSRRLANLPYILWVVTFNFGFILAFVMVDIEFLRQGSLPTVPKLFESINTNGLVLFLVVSRVFYWCNRFFAANRSGTLFQ
jgi:hypothetical protein